LVYTFILKDAARRKSEPFDCDDPFFSSKNAMMRRD
jgi:hypothetical protein